jgi:enamine deaminase RidA (YjgF/YER057c/UK114 family)
MARQHIFTGSKFEELAGYARAVIDGDWIFVSGSSGHDLESGEISDDIDAQARQSLKNILDALTEAQSGYADVVRVRVFVSERDFVWPVSAQLKEIFDEIRPANTTLITQFADPAMKVEIEVTALRQHD